MKAVKTLMVSMAVVGLTACGGGEKATGEAPANFQGIQYPEWVMKGSGAFGGEEGRVFYGVGSVSGIKNHALARTTADNRARAVRQRGGLGSSLGRWRPERPQATPPTRTARKTSKPRRNAA